jgi:hypothetical protein
MSVMEFRRPFFITGGSMPGLSSGTVADHHSTSVQYAYIVAPLCVRWARPVQQVITTSFLIWDFAPDPELGWTRNEERSLTYLSVSN